MQWLLLLLTLGLLLMLGATVIVLIAEQRRRRSVEARSRAILSSSFTDLAILDRHGVVEDCNDRRSGTRDSANPFTAAKRGEPWLPDSPAMAPDDPAGIAGVRDALLAVLSGHDAERTVECDWKTAGGHGSSRLRFCRIERREGGAIVSHLDVTASKRVEGEAQKALHELAHMNMRAGLGELVSAVTHELIQSLTASFGNAQTLKRMLLDPRVTREELAPVVDDIAAANRDGTRVIERVRQLIRKEPFDLRAVDLNAVVMDVVQVLNSSAASEGVLLVADLDPELPAINADSVQLRQVAMNLVLNAVQATRGGPVHPPVVRIATAGADSVVSITVDDAGPGIAADAMPRLFEPYFTTKANGLGVGLSISRSIVESHGGSIAAANIPAGGARFTVILPTD
jgi:C4-dicarboxylate-specific signal transduction histidine kinase